MRTPGAQTPPPPCPGMRPRPTAPPAPTGPGPSTRSTQSTPCNAPNAAIPCAASASSTSPPSSAASSNPGAAGIRSRKRPTPRSRPTLARPSHDSPHLPSRSRQRLRRGQTTPLACGTPHRPFITRTSGAASVTRGKATASRPLRRQRLPPGNPTIVENLPEPGNNSVPRRIGFPILRRCGHR